MPKVALAFFTIAPIYGLIGMGWGIYMGMSGNHLMMPAHAHLNLLGMVLNAIMGAFYALAGAQVSNRLAWINFWLSNLAVVLLIPMLAVILGGNQTVPVLATVTVAELLAVLGLASFLLNILKLWGKPAL